jgi:dsDNA-specific endonuclease/ATPase MutS2
MDPSGPVYLPIDGTLDLHVFSPKDLKTLIPDYLEECRREGIFQVRIIHGKGRGDLRRSVQAILGRLAYVTSFRLAGPGGGTWGATLVDLSPVKY